MVEKSRDHYHHGDLRTALIQATEEIIASEGLEAFSLRKATRLAGVTPGAPTHHFGGMVGLLTAVAAKTYDAIGETFAAVARSGEAARDFRALGLAYVDFAAANPGLFKLIGRSDLVNYSDPQLQQAAYNGLRIFLDCAAVYSGKPAVEPSAVPPDPELVGLLATIHGLAHMTVEGRWFRFSDDAGPYDNPAKRLLPAVLKAAWPDKRSDRGDQERN